jgi:nicotinate-nucleotide pyrophosphorylase (carboxylating)
MVLDEKRVRRLVQGALEEDIGSGDVTTEAIIAPGLVAAAHIVAKGSGTVAGIPVAIAAFQILDPGLNCRPSTRDGQNVVTGDEILSLKGVARAILGAERVALNFLQRLSGIATQAARFVAAVDGTGAKILDTRKTTPGLRYLEKYAVRMGGGHNHRMGLYDLVLIKENHIKATGRIDQAVKQARARHPRMTIEVEAGIREQVIEAAQAGADRIMLDNMMPEEIREAVDWVRQHCAEGAAPRIEASGNITLDNVRQIAMAGVDDISVGSLTHSAAALDMSLLVTRFGS